MTKTLEALRDQAAAVYAEKNFTYGTMVQRRNMSFKQGWNQAVPIARAQAIMDIIKFLEDGTINWNDTDAYAAVSILERINSKFKSDLTHLPNGE